VIGAVQYSDADGQVSRLGLSAPAWSPDEFYPAAYAIDHENRGKSTGITIAVGYVEDSPNLTKH